MDADLAEQIYGLLGHDCQGASLSESKGAAISLHGKKYFDALGKALDSRDEYESLMSLAGILAMAASAATEMGMTNVARELWKQSRLVDKAAAMASMEAK